ncbi:MAG: hypothetical protein RL186_1182, partial [Pseudomonadota bacterium]
MFPCARLPRHHEVTRQFVSLLKGFPEEEVRKATALVAAF